MVSMQYLLKGWCIALKFYTQVYNHKYRSSFIWSKIHQLFWELWPFFNFEKWFLFHNFEKISVLDSYFKHKHIIVKYRSSSIQGKIYQLFLELRAFFNVEK